MKHLNYYKNKTVLVTGGAGAIGRNLSEQLAKSKVKKIIILDNLSSSFEWNIPDLPNILFVKGDVRNDHDLTRVFRYRPQIIFHLAAFFANQKSIEYPVTNEEVNCIGLIKVLDFAKITGTVENFVYINSEGGAYGDISDSPYAEPNTSLVSSTPYYISKMAGESYSMFYQRHYHLPVSVVRLFNVYGPGEVPGLYRNVIPNFIFWALNKRPLPLTGEKGIARDFTYIDDTITGIMKAGASNEAVGHAINICSEKKTGIYDLAELINRKTRNGAGVKILKRRAWDTRPVIIGDNSKAKKMLGFDAPTGLEAGIELTIRWFRSNWTDICKSAEFPPGINPSLDI